MKLYKLFYFRKEENANEAPEKLCEVDSDKKTPVPKFFRIVENFEIKEAFWSRPSGSDQFTRMLHDGRVTKNTILFSKA